jgi:hypothetical protein
MAMSTNGVPITGMTITKMPRKMAGHG